MFPLLNEVEAWQQMWKIQSINRMWTSADVAHARISAVPDWSDTSYAGCESSFLFARAAKSFANSRDRASADWPLDLHCICEPYEDQSRKDTSDCGHDCDMLRCMPSAAPSILP